MIRAGYIDTSFLLSLLFEDDNYEKSINLWNRIENFVSSILIDIESQINVYKYFIVHLKNEHLYKEKLNALNNLLENINRKNVDDEILLEIRNVEKLNRLKSLDSIHLATAHIFNKLVDEKITICTYDINMSKIAKELGMAII